ncbi:MAG: hypothetical protein R3F62_31180 [Planctomycetota bacterium]
MFQMLARDPDERLQGAALALEALELEGGGARHSPRGATRRAPPAA